MNISIISGESLTTEAELSEDTCFQLAKTAYEEEQAAEREFKRGLKLYKKEERAYKRELKKLVKAEAPYEWSCMIDIIELMLKRRLEYFSLGHNIWQVEDSCNKIITELRECFKLLQNARNGFDTFTEDMEPYRTEENGKITYSIPDEKHEEFKAKWIQQEKDQQKAYEKAFKYFANHMRNWWD